MQGNMDEIRIWSTARTQQEILDFMNCSIVGNHTDLGNIARLLSLIRSPVAHYRFDEGNTTILVDNSLNGNDCKYVGTETVAVVPVCGIIPSSNAVQGPDLCTLELSTEPASIVSSEGFQSQTDPLSDTESVVEDESSIIPWIILGCASFFCCLLMIGVIIVARKAKRWLTTQVCCTLFNANEPSL